MAIPSRQTTVICTNCDKPVPAPNIDLHLAHCTLKLERCKFCGEMVPKRHAESHYSNSHSPVHCKLCNNTVERTNLGLHRWKSCPQRILTCELCNSRLPPGVDLSEHQEVGRNPMQVCQRCRMTVESHGNRCHSISNARHMNANRRYNQRARRNGGSHRGFLLAMVIAGVAVIFGSGFLQRKVDDHK